MKHNAKPARDRLSDAPAGGEALRASEEKFRTLFDSIDEGFAIYKLERDENGNVVDLVYHEANESFERLTGLKNVVGRRASQLVPNLEPAWYERNQRVADTGIAERIEDYVAEFDGWYSAYHQRIGGPGSDLIAVVFDDITERKERERQQEFLLKFSDALRAEQRVDAVAKRALEMLIEYLRLDRSYITTYDLENDRADLDYQIGNDSVPPLPDHFVLSDYPEAFETTKEGTLVIDDELERQGLSEEEKHNSGKLGMRAIVAATLHKDQNKPLWSMVAISSRPRRWTKGEIAVVEEVAERTWAAIERAKADHALRVSEEKYRSLFENIDEGFAVQELITNEYGNVTDVIYLEVNDAFEQHTEIKDARGKKATQFVPHLEQHWLDAMTRVYQTGEPVRLENYQADLNRWFTAQYSSIGGPGSKFVAVVFNDITERKERERQQEFLLKFADNLRTLADDKTIEETALRMLAEFLGLDRAYVFVLYPSEDRAVVRAEQRKEHLTSLLADVRMSDFPETVRQIEDQTLVVNDIDSDARLSDLNRTSLDAVNLQAFVCASFRKGERNVIWSLAAASATPRTWTKDEIELIETVAERLWAAAERAKAEAALRESEARRQFALEAAEMGTYLWYPQEDRGEPDARMIRLFGREGDTITLVDVLEKIVHPEDRKWYTALVERSLDPNGDGKLDTDFRVVHEGGSVHWLHIYGKTIFEGQPLQPVRMYGGAFDITEHKRAEEEVRAANERLSQVLESISGVFYAVDANWHLTYLNHHAEEVWHRSRQELVGTVLWDMFPNYWETQGYREHVQVMQERTPRHAEFFSPNLKTWVEVNIYPAPDGGLAVYFRDITERKRAEEALRQSQEKSSEQLHFITNLTETMPAIISVLEFPSRKLRYINRNPLGEQGFDPKEIAEMTVDQRKQLIHPDDLDALNNYYAGFGNLPDSAVATIEYRGKNKAGEWLWFRALGRVFERDPEGNVMTFLNIVQNITTYKQAEEELRESEEKYRTIFETIDEGFCIYEIVYDDAGKPVDLRWIEVNPAYETQTGLKDVVGKRHSELGLATEQYWFDIYDQVAKTGEAVHFENWHEPTARWYHVFTSRIGGAGSRQVAVVFEDITERKRRELHQALLAEVSQELVQLENIDVSTVRLGEKIATYFGVPWCMFAERTDDPEMGVAWHGWNAETASSLKGTYQMRDIWSEDVIAKNDAGEITVVNDTRTDPRLHAEMYAASGIRSFLQVPFPRYGRFKFMLSIYDVKPRQWREDEIHLMQELGSRIWAGLERARAEEALRESERQLQLLNTSLEQKVYQKTEEVRQLASEVIRSTQRERQRISQILHDDLQQRIYAIQMQMKFVQDEPTNERARLELSTIQAQLKDILQIARHLSIDLSPPILKEEGLTQAISWLGTRMQEQYGLSVEVQAAGDFVISDEELHVLLFNCVRELLFNVVKHAEARHAVVALEWVESGIQIEVRDGGTGFGKKAEERGGNGRSQKSLGLATIRHQLSLFGGSMQLHSEPGAGTRVVLFVPTANVKPEEQKTA